MTDDAALLAREAARRRQARRVLAKLDVLDRWAAVGDVHVCGAMAYRLLVARDIDIEIFGPMDIGVGFDVAAQLAQCAGVRKVTYINAIAEEDAGLGWEAVYIGRDGPWQIQMWLLPVDYPGPRSCDLATVMRARLGTAERCAILRIKEGLLATDTPYRSIDVYRAALDDGVRTVEEYRRWTVAGSSTGLLSWRPS